MAIAASTRVNQESIEAGELRTEVVRTAFESQLRARLKLVAMCNRTFEAQMSTANSVRYFEDRTALTLRDEALPNTGNVGLRKWRTGAARNTMSVAAKHLVWGRDITIDIDIPIQDIAELSVPLLVKSVDDIGERTAYQLDSWVARQWASVNLEAVKQGINPQTGTEATLDQSDVLGDAANYVNLSGEKTRGGQNTARIDLLDSLKQLKLKLKQANKAGDVAQSPTDTWRVALPPHLYYAIETELAALTNASGTFTVEQIEGRERKRLYGIFTIEESNTLPEHDISGKAHYPIYITVPRSTTYGDRLRTTFEATPGNNSDGPYYRRDEYLQYYAEVIDPRFLYRFFVRAEA